MSNVAIETLLKQKKAMEEKRDLDFFVISQEIKEVEQSIEFLSGKNISEVESEYKYDDESPNYIKGTEDGI